MTSEVDQICAYLCVFERQEIKLLGKTWQKLRPIAALLTTITVILLFIIQLNQWHFFVFHMIYERWFNKCLNVLTAAKMRGRN